MTIRFLAAARDPGKPFPGVRYNSEKVALEKGELMLVQNFGALEALAEPRPQDYINYLEAWSRQSGRIRYPQLHVALSVKGREMDKHELCAVGQQWLEGMGYGQSPYMLIFHKDTANNHLHVVASRVGADGKKVKDSYERKKAHRVMNELLGHVPSKKAEAAVAAALAFRVATRAQFMLLLEKKGYTLRADGPALSVYKYGKLVGEVPLATMEERLAAYQPDQQRLRQLRAIAGKYQRLFDPALYPVREPLPGGGQGRITGYHSELTDHLHERLGIQFVFHSRGDKPPYGYTLIDHTQKAVYKGSLLMPLAELSARPDRRVSPAAGEGEPRISGPAWEELFPETNTGELIPEVFMPAGESSFVPPLRIDIAGDIDDEQILGRNRRRKRKARTNSR